jgi:hypothetical protein
MRPFPGRTGVFGVQAARRIWQHLAELSAAIDASPASVRSEVAEKFGAALAWGPRPSQVAAFR